MQDGATTQSGWSEGLSLWAHLSEWGPLLLGALVLFAIGRAVLRRGRYRAVEVIGEAERERVHDAIRAAELHTVGEVVPVVVERSDPHPGAAWAAALCALLLGSTLLIPLLPWGQPGLLLTAQLAMAAVGFLLARALPDVARLFIPRARAEAVCQEQAVQEFQRLRLHETEASTGVLVFVSLFEHQVVVLGDEGIDAVVTPEDWSGVTVAALECIARGDVVGGLVAAVERCGTVLAEHFPWAEGDRNELPDRLEVRRE